MGPALAEIVREMLAAGFRFVQSRWRAPAWAESSEVVKEYRRKERGRGARCR